MIFLQIVLAIFLVDFLQALNHWFVDGYSNSCSSFRIWRNVSIYNEMHHYFPRNMASHSLLDDVYTIAFTNMVVFLIITVAYVGYKEHFVRSLPFFVTLFLVNMLSMRPHVYSHYRECEKTWWVRMLQQLGIFISSKSHKKHHVESGVYFGSFLGFTNYLYEGIGLWTFLNALMKGFFGWEFDNKPYSAYADIRTEWHDKAEQERCPAKLQEKERKAMFERLKTSIRCDGNVPLDRQ